VIFMIFILLYRTGLDYLVCSVLFCITVRHFVLCSNLFYITSWGFFLRVTANRVFYLRLNCLLQRQNGIYRLHSLEVTTPCSVLSYLLFHLYYFLLSFTLFLFFFFLFFLFFLLFSPATPLLI
jgi:hypothetical protein